MTNEVLFEVRKMITKINKEYSNNAEIIRCNKRKFNDYYRELVINTNVRYIKLFEIALLSKDYDEALKKLLGEDEYYKCRFVKEEHDKGNFVA